MATAKRAADLAAKAARTHGVVTRAEALAVGVTDAALKARLRRGDLVAVTRGVYVIAGSPTTDRQRVAVALARGGVGAVASHRAAAVLLGVRDRLPTRVDVTVPLGVQRWYDGLLAHPRPPLGPGDRTTRDRLPCTSPGRTAADGFDVLSPAEAARQAHEIWRRRLSGPADLRARAALPGAPPALRAFAADRLDHATDGAAEQLLLPLIRGAGLPEPACQHPVTHRGRRYVLDFAFPELRLAIEADSVAFHSTPDDLDRDRERDRALAELGWVIIRITFREARDRPEEVMRHLARRYAALCGR